MIDYQYDDYGYEYASLHRKMIVYDPRATDNVLIIDYFNTRTEENPRTNAYLKLLETDFESLKSSQHNGHPISFMMVLHEINLAWCDIINEMVFKEKAFATFSAEYCNVIKEIISCNSPKIKESTVFRLSNGESIFHMVAKLRLSEISEYSPKCKQYKEMSSELRYIFECYQQLEKCLGLDGEILHMPDFSGNSLMDLLLCFVENTSGFGVHGKSEYDN